MTNEQVPIPNSEQGRRENLLGRKEIAWKDFYLKGHFLGIFSPAPLRCVRNRTITLMY